MLNHNGQIIPTKTPLLQAENRAFQYGDALFETMRMLDGKLPFLADHVERLSKGMDYLGYEGSMDEVFLENEIKKLTGEIQNARIRLQVYRAKGGLYTPKNNKTNYLITFSLLDNNRFVLNKKGLTIGFYSKEYLPCTPLSNLKTSNSLPYILAARYREKMGWDDCLLFNGQKNIAEASSSNIFLVKDGKVCTPAANQGCVLGVFRKQVLSRLEKNGIPFEETAISPLDIEQADEIFLTNAIQGIRWVGSLGEKEYGNGMAKQLLEFSV